MLESPRNYFIKEAEINWARLDTPVSPFGTPQYELQAATDNKATAKEWKENHLNVKEKDGKFIVSLKRKARKANGEDNGAPKVVNADLSPFDKTVMIGNGSTANVKIYQYPYDVNGKKGVGSSLTAVQLVNLVEYKGGTNDDFVAYESEGAEPAANKSDDLF